MVGGTVVGTSVVVSSTRSRMVVILGAGLVVVVSGDVVVGTVVVV